MVLQWYYNDTTTMITLLDKEFVLIFLDPDLASRNYVESDKVGFFIRVRIRSQKQLLCFYENYFFYNFLNDQ